MAPGKEITRTAAARDRHANAGMGWTRLISTSCAPLRYLLGDLEAPGTGAGPSHSAPNLLLCDEICGGLSPIRNRHHARPAAAIRRAGTTIIYVEHDVRAIMAVCDRVIVINYGQKLAEGTHEIQNNPAVIEAYLGKPASG